MEDQDFIRDEQLEIIVNDLIAVEPELIYLKAGKVGVVCLRSDKCKKKDGIPVFARRRIQRRAPRELVLQKSQPKAGYQGVETHADDHAVPSFYDGGGDVLERRYQHLLTPASLRRDRRSRMGLLLGQLFCAETRYL